MFFVTFFEKKVTPKNFTVGKVFGLHSAFDGYAHYVRTNQSRKVFVHLFQKVAGVKGRVAPYIVRKTQERVNFFALQRKRENPRRGFSFFS